MESIVAKAASAMPVGGRTAHAGLRHSAIKGAALDIKKPSISTSRPHTLKVHALGIGKKDAPLARAVAAASSALLPLAAALPAVAEEDAPAALPDAGAAADAAKAAAGEASDAAKAAAGEAADAAKAAADQASDAAKAAADQASKAAADALGGVTDALGGITGKAGSAFSGISKSVEGATSGITGSVSSAKEGLTGGISSGASSVTGAVDSTISSITDTLQGIEDSAVATWSGLIDAAIAAVPPEFESFVDLARDDPIIAAILISSFLALPAAAVYQLQFSGYAGKLSPRQAAELLEEGGDVLLLDVRPKEAREEKGVPDLRRRARGKALAAEQVPISPEFRTALKGVPDLEARKLGFTVAGLRQVGPKTKVIVMNADGRKIVELARTFADCGVSRPYALSGGFAGWASSGQRVKEGSRYDTGALRAVGEDLKAAQEDERTVLSKTASAVSETAADPSGLGKVAAAAGGVALVASNYKFVLELAGVSGLILTAVVLALNKFVEIRDNVVSPDGAFLPEGYEEEEEEEDTSVGGLWPASYAAAAATVASGSLKIKSAPVADVEVIDEDEEIIMNEEEEYEEDDEEYEEYEEDEEEYEEEYEEEEEEEVEGSEY